jgi:hypothetical protein
MALMAVIFLALAFALFAVLRLVGANALVSVCVVAAAFIWVAITAGLGVLL